MNLSILNFKLRALSRLSLPFYKGSTFRGAFGHALKHIVCVAKQAECTDCPLISNCAYAYLFETRNEKGQAVAHPYIIEPPMKDKQDYERGDFIHVTIKLIGKAVDYAAYVVYAFMEMGKKGVGRGGGRFELDEVYSRMNGRRHMIYEKSGGRLLKVTDAIPLFAIDPVSAEEATLHFSTVTALKSGGRIVFNPDFETVIRAVFRRIKALSVYHNGRSFIELPDFTAHPVQVKKSNLRRSSWARYSNRQQKKIGYDGFVGSLTFNGDLTPYTLLLQMGHYVHIGRGTVYGMGKYELELNN